MCHEMLRFDGNSTFTGFLSPIHIVMASVLKVYKQKTINFNPGDRRDYAINMNYYNPLDIDASSGLHHSKAIKLRPTYDQDEQVEKITSIIKNNSYLDDDSIKTLNIIIAELFSNFYDHAESDSPPICCVQGWSNGWVEIAIADCGMGIRGSLVEILKQDEYVNENACRLACQNGISSKLGKNHSGYGLFFTKRFIEENNGVFYLASGNECYSVISAEESISELPYNWEGTIIRLKINKNNSINSESFFQMISREQGCDDEFF